MVKHAQNGWSVLEAAPPAVEVVSGVRLTIRPGDVAVVLGEVASRFHAIEPIDAGTVRDDWGWAYRPVRGQSDGFSNHAAGCAIDLNALKHPRGVKGTFTQAKIRAIDAELARFRSPTTGRQVVRWGEHYTSTVDGMHFEIVGNAAEVAEVAELIRHSRGAFAPPAEPEGDDMALSDADKAWITAAIKAAVPTPQQVADALLNTRSEVFRDGDKDGRRDIYTVRQMLAAAPIAQTAVDKLDALTRLVMSLSGQPVAADPQPTPSPIVAPAPSTGGAGGGGGGGAGGGRGDG